MKGKQLLEIIDSPAKIFVNIESLFTPMKIKVDRNDLRDEIIYTCQGNMEIECGVRVVQQANGSYMLVAEDDSLLPKTA